MLTKHVTYSVDEALNQTKAFTDPPKLAHLGLVFLLFFFKGTLL